MYFHGRFAFWYGAALRMPASNQLILLIEDSADDVLLFKRALREAALQNPLQVVDNVDDGICYIEGQGRFADRAHFPPPAIVILDLRMPQRNGFDFLEWLGKKQEPQRLHIVVISGVGRIEEINRAYSMGADSFLTKPIKAADLSQLATSFAAYWT